MRDERIKYFDELGDLILRIPSHVSGVELGKLAADGLIILNRIIKILNESEKYEHGLQRASDVVVLLEAVRDDYCILEDDYKSLIKNYYWFRVNSNAGNHSEISDFK